MAEMLVYWRAYAANWAYQFAEERAFFWHSSAKCIADLQPGEPNAEGSSAPLIDALHRCCAFRDKGDTGGLSEYLARSGHGRNEKLWTVAQAMSEVLPDGDKDKQLLQGLLNQRDKIDEALAEERSF